MPTKGGHSKRRGGRQQWWRVALVTGNLAHMAWPVHSEKNVSKVAVRCKEGLQ